MRLTVLSVAIARAVNAFSVPSTFPRSLAHKSSLYAHNLVRLVLCRWGNWDAEKLRCREFAQPACERFWKIPRQADSRGEPLKLIICCVPHTYFFTAASLVWDPYCHLGVYKSIGSFNISIFVQVFNGSILSGVCLIIMVLRMVVCARLYALSTALFHFLHNFETGTVLSLFYRWGNWGFEEVNWLPQTHAVSGGTRISAQPWN